MGTTLVYGVNLFRDAASDVYTINTGSSTNYTEGTNADYLSATSIKLTGDFTSNTCQLTAISYAGNGGPGTGIRFDTGNNDRYIQVNLTTDADSDQFLAGDELMLTEEDEATAANRSFATEATGTVKIATSGVSSGVLKLVNHDGSGFPELNIYDGSDTPYITEIKRSTATLLAPVLDEVQTTANVATTLSSS